MRIMFSTEDETFDVVISNRELRLEASGLEKYGFAYIDVFVIDKDKDVKEEIEVIRNDEFYSIIVDGITIECAVYHEEDETWYGWEFRTEE